MMKSNNSYAPSTDTAGGSRPKRHSGSTGAAPAIAALCAGLALVWLAAPRTIAGLLELPAQPAIALLRSGAPVDPGAAAIAADSQAAALAWVEDGRSLADVELLRQAADDVADGSAVGPNRRLEESIALHRRSLGLSPAQAYVWTRLARAELVWHGPAPRLGPMLELAITTAPSERRLALPRLELCFLVWRQIDARLHGLATEQARIAARLSVRRLAEMAKRRYATAMARAALAGDRELSKLFDAALVRL